MDGLEDKDLIITQLIRGERPKNMSYEEYKIKRSAIKLFFKRRKKGWSIKKQ